jgi:hypothetical protein
MIWGKEGSAREKEAVDVEKRRTYAEDHADGEEDAPDKSLEQDVHP